MKIHLRKILHMLLNSTTVFAEIRFVKFSPEDRVFGDSNLDIEST
jgi:intein-encoded DNA endonuclease-like protein